MKYCFAVLSTAVLIAATPQVLAASTVDLAVTGVITPAACLPTLSSGGVVDFDKIAAKDLRPTGSTSLPDHTLTLQVSCDSAILFALRATDNRAGTASQTASLYFGLGLINGNQKLGGYSLVMMNTVADGAQAMAITSKDGKTDWSANLFWWPTQYMSVAAMDNVNQPIAARNVTLDLLIGTSIARADGLDLSNEVPIDGSATLEISYL